MIKRPPCSILLLIVLDLMACSSGSSTTPNMISGGKAQTTPTQASTPPSQASSSPYAISVGSSARAVGSRTETLQNNTFNALPSRQTVYSLSQTITGVNKANPFGTGGVDMQTVETSSSNLETSTVTIDAWYSFGSTPNGGQQLQLLGEKTTDNDSATPYTVSVKYAHPLVLDVYGRGSNMSWTNDAAAAVDESDAGTMTSRRYQADGSYVEIDQSADGSTQTIVENADGSGSYISTDLAFGFETIAPVVGFSFSAPQQDRPGSAGTSITISGEAPRATQIAPPFTPPFKAFTYDIIPPWYYLPVKLYSESDSVADGVPVPDDCDLASGTPPAHLVKRLVNRVDTVIGYTEEQDTRTYSVPGLGPVCVLLTDQATSFFDYTLQNRSPFPIFGGQPLRLTTISESVHTTSNSTPKSPSSLDTRQIAPIFNRFFARVEHMRSLRSKAFRLRLEDL